VKGRDHFGCLCLQINIKRKLRRWLLTESSVGNNQLSKNREKGRVGSHGKSTERRGLGPVVKVKPTGTRKRSISGRGSVGGGEKSRATGRSLTQ
jgi:hypothetical protein